MSLSMTLPVIPLFLSFSVEVYTPVRTPAVKASGASTSGWTMLMRPLNVCGFPKKRKVLPGTRRPCIHLIPLKKTTSISPESSPMITDRRLTRLYLTLSAGTSAPFLAKSLVLRTVARTWMKAWSGITSAMRWTVLRSMYRKGYRWSKSPTVSISSSDFSSAARLGPTPGRYCMSMSIAVFIWQKYEIFCKFAVCMGRLYR